MGTRTEELQLQDSALETSSTCSARKIFSNICAGTLCSPCEYPGAAVEQQVRRSPNATRRNGLAASIATMLWIVRPCTDNRSKPYRNESFPTREQGERLPLVMFATDCELG